MTTEWSNLARVVFRRTYARKDTGRLENWNDTVERAVLGNVRGRNVPEQEVKKLIEFSVRRKSTFAGRGLWFSGSPAHSRIGGAACNNCWFFTAEDWFNFVVAQDLLMLGGGVGLSVQHKYVSQLPRIKKGVEIQHIPGKDAQFIVPDSREGWCDLLRKVLKSFFVSGKGFTYSTYCVRGYGEDIKGFGGVASGPRPLIDFVTRLSSLLNSRAGKAVRPIDAADILTLTAEMVVAGNVRRSAIIIIGDPHDKEYLKAKRWDLAPLPTHRSNANYSVYADDVDDLHPLFWKTYEIGEPFGLVNLTNAQKYGRIGELRPDTAAGTNPCGEALLESGEPCVSGDTPLVHRHGIGYIRELVGQAIEIWNGNGWRKVIPRLTGRQRKLLRVRFNDGSYLDCTPNHGFSVKDRFESDFTRVRADGLMSYSKYGAQLEPYSPMEHTTGVVLEDAYTLGTAIGDGGVDGDDVVLFLYGKKQELPVSGTRGCLEQRGRAVALQRVRTGFDPGRLSSLKHGTDDDLNVLFSLSRISILELLAGWLDTDGSETGTGGVRLYLSHEERARRMQLLLTRVGIRASVNKMAESGEKTNYGTRNKSIWYLQITNCSQIPCRRLDTSRGHEPRGKGKYQNVKSVEELSGLHDTYCFDEPERHMGVFANVLTYQCNLVEQALNNMDNEAEFLESSRLWFRAAKRVTMEKYHHEMTDRVIKRNRRVGVGITGCLMSPLFNPETLDRAYRVIQEEDERYSTELNIPRSIRTTLVKPSGTMSKVLDCAGYEGIHPAFSRYMIQRVRFSSDDPLIPKLKAAGHYMEPVLKFDGTTDPRTLVVDFYQRAPDGYPVADEDWDTWKQLEVVKMVNRYWSDQSTSVTVYYEREELDKLKQWLRDNLQYVKTISFLCHSAHGFKQAPKEAITQEQYEKLSAKIRPLDFEDIGEGDMESVECAGGYCPIK